MIPHLIEPELRQIPIQMLTKYYAQLDEQTLDALAASPAYFQWCPIQVKQRVWTVNVEQYAAYLLPMMAKYAADAFIVRLANEMRLHEISLHSKERRDQRPIVQDMVEAIGSDYGLYKHAQELLHTVYLTNGHPMVSMLRVDVIMGLHEYGQQELLALEPCYNLVWSLDAAQKSQQLDSRRLEDLRKMLDGLMVDKSTFLSLSACLSDPRIMHTLTSHLITMLWTASASSYKLTQIKNDRNLLWILQALTIGVQAHRMLQHSTVKLPKVDKTFIVGKWLVSFARMMGRDAKGQEERDMPDDVLQLCRENDTARMILYHYTVDRLHNSDMLSVTYLLPCVLQVINDAHEQETPWPLHDAFLQTVGHSILQQPKLLRTVAWKQLLMDHVLVAVAVVYHNWTAHIQVVSICVHILQDISKQIKRLKEKEEVDVQDKVPYQSTIEQVEEWVTRLLERPWNATPQHYTSILTKLYTLLLSLTVTLSLNVDVNTFPPI